MNALSPSISSADWGITPRDLEVVRAVLPRACGWLATPFDDPYGDIPFITVDGPGGFQALIGKEDGQFQIMVWDEADHIDVPQTIRGLSSASEAAFALFPGAGRA